MTADNPGQEGQAHRREAAVGTGADSIRDHDIWADHETPPNDAAGDLGAAASKETGWAGPGTAPAGTTATPERVTAAGKRARAEKSDPPGAGRRAIRAGGAFFRELPGLLLLAFILALLIKTFLIQAFYIPSGSMEHTLDVGDRVLVNKVVYHIHPPRRGDIIVFSEPHPLPQPDRSPLSALVHWLTDGLGLSMDPNKDFIKRVIGLPGETIEVNRGVVYIDGKALDERYQGPAPSTGNFEPDTVGTDELFVMGDNRGDSNDSRGTLGNIPMDKVVGRAFVIIWPPSRMAILRRPHYSDVFSSSAAGVIPLAATAFAISRRRRRTPAFDRPTA